MKKLIRPLLALMFLALIGQSCVRDVECVKGTGGARLTREFPADSFNAVSLWFSGDVIIKKGAEPKIELNAEESILNAIIIETNNDGRLELGRRNCFRSHKRITVTITAPSITGIELNGSGSIIMQDEFEEAEIEAYINGSGEIEARAKANKFIGRINGSGELTAIGSANEADYNINGSGDIYAYTLEAENCTVNISGSGDARVKANKTLIVSISGSGTVHYKGNPVVTSNISGSGEVVNKN